MAYGIEVRNNDNVLVLDNRPMPVLEVIESGTLASGYPIPTITDPSVTLYVRPSVNGTTLHGATNNSSGGSIYLSSSSGAIDYVKIKPCIGYGGSNGYGLAVYDNTGAAALVFNSNMRHVSISDWFRSGILPNQTITRTMRATLPGRYKYMNASAFAVINWYQTYYNTVSWSLSADGSVAYYGTVYMEQKNTSLTDINWSHDFYIIEC